MVASIDNVTIKDDEEAIPLSSPTKGKGKDQVALPMIPDDEDDEDEFPVSTVSLLSGVRDTETHRLVVPSVDQSTLIATPTTIQPTRPLQPQSVSIY